MTYVIRRADGYFVTPPGSKRSYTRQLQNARQFNSFAEAEPHYCENETVMSLAAAMNTRPGD